MIEHGKDKLRLRYEHKETKEIITAEIRFHDMLLGSQYSVFNLAHPTKSFADYTLISMSQYIGVPTSDGVDICEGDVLSHDSFPEHLYICAYKGCQFTFVEFTKKTLQPTGDYNISEKGLQRYCKIVSTVWELENEFK